MILYGVHGAWLTEEIIQSGWSGGWISPQGLFSVLFVRLGAEAPASVFEGFWVPGPASLLNDLGLWGMLSFGVAVGAITGIVVGCLRTSRITFAVYALVFLVSFWFLSFLVFPTNIPGFVISIWLGLFLWFAHVVLKSVQSLISKRYS